MSADAPICLSVIGADGAPAGLVESDPAELARTEETAQRWDITGYEVGDAELVEAAANVAQPSAPRRGTVLLHATPSLCARIEAFGYAPGQMAEGMLPWLVEFTEFLGAALREAEARLEMAGLDEEDEP